MVPGDTIPLTSVLRDRMATQAELSGEDVALWKKVKVGGAQQKVRLPLPPPLPGSGSQADPQSLPLRLCAHSPNRPGFGALTARFWAPGLVWGARGAGPTLLLGATKGDRCSAQRAAGLCRLHPSSFTLRTFPELPCLGPCHPHSDSPQD